jgi:hypothetical protein
VRGLGVRQIAGLVDEDDPAGHGRVPFQSKAPCRLGRRRCCRLGAGHVLEFNKARCFHNRKQTG